MSEKYDFDISIKKSIKGQIKEIRTRLRNNITDEALIIFVNQNVITKIRNYFKDFIVTDPHRIASLVISSRLNYLLKHENLLKHELDNWLTDYNFLELGLLKKK